MALIQEVALSTLAGMNDKYRKFINDAEKQSEKPKGYIASGRADYEYIQAIYSGNDVIKTLDKLGKKINMREVVSTLKN